ncbi:tyrosine-type recombinase/integrase [Actinophytocola algeriensis]|nr:site-specific integrase [Actinophytocola algeriensis]
MARRRSNGEGSIYRRKDGRWEGAVYVLTTGGIKKRVSYYGRTRNEVQRKLRDAQHQADQGVPFPERNWRLDDYLDYWLEHVVRPNLRPATYARYAVTVRLYLKPGLGTRMLTQLTVPIVQTYLNAQHQAGSSVRNLYIIRETLSSALTCAMREELLTRNVARLVRLPTYYRPKIQPWTPDEAARFLTGARTDPLFPAFLVMVIYGLRVGEALGLRWGDVDEAAGVIRVRQQLQRVLGNLRQAPVKTESGQRDLPLLDVVQRVLARHRTTAAGHCSPDDLVFTTSTGRPIEPRNLTRSFKRLCQQHQVRVTRVHDIRHATATMLKNFGVPVRDAQLILGHSNVSTTQEVYQHADVAGQRRSLRRVESVFARALQPNENDGDAGERCRQDRVLSRQIRASSLWSKLRLPLISMEPTEGFEPTTHGLQSALEDGRRSFATRAQSVRLYAKARMSLWLLGVAAVSLAVKSEHDQRLPST